MEWPKIKNIILLILLFVNGFLLALIGGQQVQVRQYERSALTKAAAVLEQNGISVSEKVMKGAACTLAEQGAQRDIQAERALAQQLLGEGMTAADQSGGLYVYTSDRGTVIFRAAGGFDASLSDYATEGADPEQFSLDLLRRLGIEGEAAARDGNLVICRQLLDGTPLFSSRLTFEYSQARLLSISGTVLLGEPAPTGSDSRPLDVATALIRFLEGVLESGDVCTALVDMRPGYRWAQSFDGTIQLTPVWMISTDVSEYYLDGVTGKLSRV